MGRDMADVTPIMQKFFDTHIHPYYRFTPGGTFFVKGKKVPLSIAQVIKLIQKNNPTDPLEAENILSLPAIKIEEQIRIYIAQWYAERVLAPTTLDAFGKAVFGMFRFFYTEDGRRIVFYRNASAAPPNQYLLLGVDPDEQRMYTAFQSVAGSSVVLRYYYENWVSIFGDIAVQDVPEFPAYFKKLIPIFFNDSSFVLKKMPELISADPSTPCFYYVDFSKIVPGPHPAWDSFCSQMTSSHQKIFKAWLYSIFVPKNKGRQVLWMSDDGFTGKSTITRVVSSLLKGCVAAISHGAVDRDFFFSSVYGKRLVIYGDNKNPNLLMTEKIHALCGGDIVYVEKKHEPAFSAAIYSKLWVMSNILPEVNTHRRHETSRILHIPLQGLTEGPHFIQGDPCGSTDFEKDLTDEFWYFLYDCKKDYADLCPTDNDLIIPKEDREKMREEVISTENTRFETLIEDYLDVTDPEARIKQGDLYNFIRSHFHNDFAYGHFKQYLRSVYNIHTIFKERPRVLKGLKFKSVTQTQPQKAGGI